MPVDEQKGKPQQIRPLGGGGPLSACRDSGPHGSSLNIPHCTDSGTTHVVYLILELNFKSPKMAYRMRQMDLNVFAVGGSDYKTATSGTHRKDKRIGNKWDLQPSPHGQAC